MKRTVISYKALPGRLPLWPTITLLLALDVWHAPDVVRGAAWLCIALIWALSIWIIVTETKKTPEGFGDRPEAK